ncbi:methyltransferase [Algibacter amylolyticus]|uniref:tRNA1(Val) (adenine(37)-N6)-methyltransferase n=1 Tax=Algibacter amylolyticus TaxID=1608400 RepID=A0A5M7BEW9_9FLAO|nr:methyltransferase [Algibacter amylolyticus]KAA5827942.1 methyltransferase [Algibacter amylolyticus]MBB5267176.1 tRNA1Val (adenine37-N6)-methyltransferase [Algibacter amylolyticus]TSJ82187.1 methyltransferase [Algibacter amylolyticus]
MSKKPFVFKEFQINHDQCAMKIGTDGVLLGAWTSLKNRPFSILDIGAGTGVLALMLAQRSDAEIIDAIEIDDSAFEQCVDNFEQSPWGDRLFCYHASLADFTEELETEEDRYDIIICNPPFYSEDYKTDNNQRDLARFQDAMPFNHLLESTSKLLSEIGVFSVVIPFKESSTFIQLASEFNLFPNRILHVKGNPTSEIKRALIEFSFRSSETTMESLIIETERHQYTEAYINLTKDFYLKM